MVHPELGAQAWAMRHVGEQIRSMRRARGLTLHALAAHVGCGKGYLSEIENGRRSGPPSRALLARLEEALHAQPGSLVRLGELQATPEAVREEYRGLEAYCRRVQRLAAVVGRSGLDEAYRTGRLRRFVEELSGDRSSGIRSEIGESPRPIAIPMQVPIINKIAAGYPREFTDLGYPARVADEYVSVPEVYDADAFAARVVGDSMEPEYREGDVVVFSPSSSTPAGCDCFVRLERDEETTFKRVYFEEGAAGEHLIRLQPLNSAYPPRVVQREAVAGLYAAVYVVRPVRRSPGA